MEEEEKDDNNSDILTRFTNFVDDNLRLFRNVSWILAGAGIVLILRRTYVNLLPRTFPFAAKSEK